MYTVVCGITGGEILFGGGGGGGTETYCKKTEKNKQMCKTSYSSDIFQAT
jgi:hypothetical protein